MVLGDLTNYVNGRPSKIEYINIKFIIQKFNTIILLPDGVGFKEEAESTELPIGKFAYSLLNKVDTNIVLTTRAKLYFLVKVVESEHRERVEMSMNDKHFSSPMDRFYFL